MGTHRVLVSVLLIGLVASTAWAQDKPATPPKGEDRPAAQDPHGEMSPEMKAAMAAMQPGPAHEKLAKLAGDWTVLSKLTMPGAPAEETTGAARIVVVMGGRFIHEEATGTMHGMEFSSAKLLGYNNGSKKYEGIWTYTMGTAIMSLNGTSDDDGKTVKCTATWDNEIGVKESMTITYRFTDDDHFSIAMDAGKMPDGSAGPVLELAYTRKK